MESSQEKKVDVENHGVSTGYNDGRRGSTMAEKVRHSISIGNEDDGSIEGQVFSMNDVDPALDAKMRLVNQVHTICLLNLYIRSPNATLVGC